LWHVLGFETQSMKLALVVALASGLAACAQEPEDDWASASESNNTEADHVSTLRSLAPIAVRSTGILTAEEEARRGGFVQGFFGGQDDDGRACSVHVIHYTRESLPEVWIHAWRNDDAKGTATYSEDFDRNTTGVEKRDVIEYGARHQVSLSRLSDARVRVEDRTMLIDERQIVKSSDGDDARDVEVEVKKLDEPGGGITVRIKKTLRDDVVRCHDLVARKTIMP
jgi:hypothetical protein